MHLHSQPQYSARIELDGAPHALAAGDVLRGRVLIQNGPNRPDRPDIRQVMVVFSGRAKTRLLSRNQQHNSYNKGYNSERGRALLCYIETIAQPEPMNGDVQSFGFSITVPGQTNAEALQRQAYENSTKTFHTDYWSDWAPDETFTALEPGVPLPPSMSAAAGDDDWECYVGYELAAVVDGAATTSMRLVYVNLPPAPERMRHLAQQRGVVEKHFEIKSMRLLQENVGRDIGFREKLSAHLFHRDELPVYSFNASVGCSSNLQLDAPVEICVAIKPNVTSGDPPIVTDVEIRSLEIKLLAPLAIRVKSWGGDRVYDTRAFEVWRSVIADAPDSTLCVLSSSNDYSQVWTSAPLVLPGDGSRLTPSFLTCNISQGYTVHIKAELRCAGETEMLKVDIPVFVHPSARVSMQSG